MYKQCNIIECIHNQANSIALCLGLEKLDYDYWGAWAINKDVQCNSLNCLKYKVSKVK